jgi:beta-glucosidase-like glycosyl hydrolase
MGSDLRTALAQSIFPRIDCRTYVGSEEYRERIIRLVDDRAAGGFVLFDGDVEQVSMITATLGRIGERRLLFAADCEDGVTMRFAGGTEFPSMMALGEADDVSATYAVARSIAREMRALGLHWNFAPVADINTNPENPIINIRSFGESPELVGRHVDAYVRGLQDEGIVACAKHFPGHGDTERDSHLEVPVVRSDRARLESIELVPFRSAIAAGVRSIKVSHVAIPALDPTGTPTSLSPVLAEELIRSALGYRGVIVTDALDMSAITDAMPAADAAVSAYLAGSDVLETLPDPTAALDALERAAANGTIPAERVSATLARIEALRSFALEQRETLELEKIRSGHEVIALEAARRSVRVTGSIRRLYPPLFVVAVADDRTVAKAEEWFVYFSAWYPGEASGAIATPEMTDADMAEMLRCIDSAGTVIAALFVRPRGGAGSVGLSEHQQQVVRHASERTLVLLNFGNPYLLRDLDARFRVDTFSMASASLAVSVEVLGGAVSQ